MKTFAVLCCILGIAVAIQAAMDPAEAAYSCSYECEVSPSGRMIALSGIGLGEVSPSFRLRLRVLVVQLRPDGDRLEHIWPWMKGDWVVIWAPRDVLVVCGHPENREQEAVDQITAYYFSRDGKATMREANEEEKKQARFAFHKKYGRDPQA